MKNITFARNELLMNTVIKNLEKRNFNAFYCSTKEEAVKKAFELINKEEVVSWGGSVTLDEIGIKEILDKNGYKTIDRAKAKTKEEKMQMAIQSLSADVFLMSTNAMTEDGILINIDGTGNRVAALCFGPKKVIVFAGANKIVKTIDDAISRARNISAPINAKRVSSLFDMDTPCLKTGSCLNCKSQSSICSQIVTTRLSGPKGRINVILINEELGY